MVYTSDDVNQDPKTEENHSRQPQEIEEQAGLQTVGEIDIDIAKFEIRILWAT
jgi:hypothetical protein